MSKKAFITGITGQDGSYLAELLLNKNYEVHGIIRRSSSFNTKRIDHIFNDLHLYHGDLGESFESLLYQINPDELYNLGAQSHVRVSFELPLYTADITGIGALRVLEAVRLYTKNVGKVIKVYQASSSEMFGKVLEIPQTEKTSFNPQSPYGCAKVFAFQCAKNYRDGYGMFVSNGILFNHESPRRGGTFVTKKVVKGLVNIFKGHQKELRLGNLVARRDWGYAPDFVEAMWLMLQQDKPQDFVVATGEMHSIEELLNRVSQKLDGLNWRDVVKIDLRYIRPNEVDMLLGDSSKAKKILGWEPRVKFNELVDIMVEAELKGESYD